MGIYNLAPQAIFLKLSVNLSISKFMDIYNLAPQAIFFEALCLAEGFQWFFIDLSDPENTLVDS